MRRWSMLAVVPFVAACAAVLGLEEAELEEKGSGGEAGTSGRSSGGGGGSDPSEGGTIDPGAAGAAGDVGGGGELGAGGGDVGAGGMTGATGGRVSKGGAGGTGGTPSRGGSGTGGGTPPPMGGSGPTACMNTDPSTCTSATSVRYCNNGTLRTVACSTRCTEAGFDAGTGMCTSNVCMCGDALDLTCAAGVFVYCECQAQAGTPCTTGDQSALYQLCYQEDPSYEPALVCLAQYAESTVFDCNEAGAVCSPSAFSP